MKELKLNISIEELSFDELTAQEQSLVNDAIEATNRSYANYSHFHVGAAIRLENGEVIKGANQENAAFPVCICAERTAIFAAQVKYPDQPILQIAIAARNDNGLMGEPVSPCGPCRQVMSQMEDRYKKPMSVILYGTSKIYRLKSAKDLLPLSFEDEDML